MRGGPGSLTSYSGGGTSGGADRGPSSLSDVDKGICLSIGLQGCRGGGLLYTQFEAVVTIIPALITNRPPWSPCRNFLYKGSFDRNCKCGELFRFQPISKPYYSICHLWKCNDSNELRPKAFREQTVVLILEFVRLFNFRRQKTEDKLVKATKDASKITTEVIHGMMTQVTQVF